MGGDSYYTPTTLATKLLSLVPSKSFSSVADFCVGDGELLRAASAKFPEIQCYGTDIDMEVIKRTQLNHPEWTLNHLDFTDSTARKKFRFPKGCSKYDLLLLNPPFSCRGGTVHTILYRNRKFSCSTAMMFLVVSLSYMSASGSLYAIMPAGVAYSQRDSKLWAALEADYNLAILEESQVHYFSGCTPNVIMVSLNDFKQRSKKRLPVRIPLDLHNLTVTRGKISMNKVELQEQGIPLIHTVNLRDNALVNLNLRVAKNTNSVITGPCVLLPRVGNTNALKLVALKTRDNFAISDCILAIKTMTLKDADILFKYLVSNWNVIDSLYQGTGAKFITLDRIAKFLNLDISAEEPTSSIGAHSSSLV